MWSRFARSIIFLFSFLHTRFCFPSLWTNLHCLQRILWNVVLYTEAVDAGGLPDHLGKGWLVQRQRYRSFPHPGRLVVLGQDAETLHEQRPLRV